MASSFIPSLVIIRSISLFVLLIVPRWMDMDNEQSEYLWDIILLIWWLLFLLFDLSYLLLLKLSSDRSNSSFVSIVTLFNLIVDPIIGSLELFVSSRILQFDISGHIGLELSIASRILGLVINSILLYIVGRMLVKRI